MPLTKFQKKEIDTFISSKIEDKLRSYGRETRSMPFLARIIQDNEKIAACSFMHSISTSLVVFMKISLLLLQNLTVINALKNIVLKVRLHRIKRKL